jgi:LuxR family transcriptional regulator
MARDRAALFGAVDAATKSLGFNTFLLFCHRATKREMILESTLTDFQDSFLVDYDRFDWSEDDFLLDCMLQTQRPVVWNTRNVRYEAIRKQSYIDFLHASAMCTGLIVPLNHRPNTASAFSLIADSGSLPPVGLIQATTVLANAAMTKAEVLGLCPEISVDEASAVRLLSNVQLEVWDWIAEGKSNNDIATITGMSGRTVRYHVTEILRKLGVATRMQAAALRRSGSPND